MDTQLQNEERQLERVYRASCCGLQSRFGAFVWGSAWVLIGSVFLLSNMGLLPYGWSGIFWPLLIIGIGLAHLGGIVNRLM